MDPKSSVGNASIRFKMQSYRIRTGRVECPCCNTAFHCKQELAINSCAKIYNCWYSCCAKSVLFFTLVRILNWLVHLFAFACEVMILFYVCVCLSVCLLSTLE